MCLAQWLATAPPAGNNPASQQTKELTAATCASSSGSIRLTLPLPDGVPVELPPDLAAAAAGMAAREARPPLSSPGLWKVPLGGPLAPLWEEMPPRTLLRATMPDWWEMVSGVSCAWEFPAERNGLAGMGGEDPVPTAPDAAREAIIAKGLAAVEGRSWKLRSTGQAAAAQWLRRRAAAAGGGGGT